MAEDNTNTRSAALDLERDQRDSYLDTLFSSYQEKNNLQSLFSSTANMGNLFTDIMTFNKSKDLLEVSDFDVAPKSNTRIRRQDVSSRYDRFADKALNTGAKQAREGGRLDLLPGVINQATEISLEGQQAQNDSDLQTANIQAQINSKENAEYQSRVFAAEGAKFQAENEMSLHKANLQGAFGQQLKSSISTQAEIANKSLMEPLQTSVDWFDKFGYVNAGIMEKYG